jgi:hypothetical protein
MRSKPSYTHKSRNTFLNIAKKMGEHVSNFTRSILPFVPKKKKKRKSILIGETKIIH